ncbi:hypothetical protein ACFXPR_10695 [Nocardia tengchongensis]|uniref:hypothetical protein n=1 Tax=Nocardia tengchongensis TaxID=2055889 RepID=UPI0036811354
MRIAVELARKMAAVAPRLDTELANVLRISARSLIRVGEYERALAATEEAVRISRRGLVTGRGRYRSGLAMSLCLQADLLSIQGRHSAAVAAAREAITVCRHGIAADPRRFGPALLASLDTLARALDELGDHQQALPPGEEHVRILRGLTPHRPAYRHALATGLHMVGVYASGTGRFTDALRATDEAIQLYQRLDQEQPGTFASKVVTATENRDLFLDRLQRAGDVVLGPYPLCALCEPVNGGLVAVRHRQRHLQVGDRQACVDSEIADILAILWEHGCDTVSCCEDTDGRAEVVPARGHAGRVVAVLAGMGIPAEVTDGVVHFHRPALPPQPTSSSSRARILVGRLLGATLRR